MMRGNTLMILSEECFCLKFKEGLDIKERP